MRTSSACVALLLVSRWINVVEGPKEGLLRGHRHRGTSDRVMFVCTSRFSKGFCQADTFCPLRLESSGGAHVVHQALTEDVVFAVIAQLRGNACICKVIWL